MSVALRPIGAAAAAAVAAGRRPDDVRVAGDYPTEFSHEVAAFVGNPAQIGPFFIVRTEDDVVVGETGGMVDGETAEIGYAIVESAWGRGHATDALRLLIEEARADGRASRLIAHTPLDRPASGRVVEKGGFTLVDELEEEHDGVVMRVRRWELRL